MNVSAPRRTDLDSLRGFAMGLGIVLHATMSFFPSPWPVQDTQQSGYFYLLFAAIHSFRMPLFFVLSGFFTAFLLQRNGVGETVRQRALRLLLPLLLALATIAPLSRMLYDIGAELTWTPRGEAEPMVSAIIHNDDETVRREFDRLEPDWRDGTLKLSAVYWAALAGHPEIVEWLLSQGGQLDWRSPEGLTPLHVAALFGNDRAVAVLLDHGADPAALDSHGQTPFQTSIAWAVSIPRWPLSLGLPSVPPAELAERRARISELLLSKGPRPLDAISHLYNQALRSNTFRFAVGGTEFQIFDSDFFYHLWFLWVLWWIFVVYAAACKFGLAPSGRHLWVFPLMSLAPQWFMLGGIGADVWTGPVPPPHILVFYGCFFWFGAAVFRRDGMQARMGAHWKILLPLGLLILLPACFMLLGNRLAATLVQAATAWVLLLGVIGIFHRYGSNLGPKARWISDSAYWMYLAHLPLVMMAQLAVAFLPWPPVVKFLLVNAAVIAVLLASYQWFVRYTWVGALLNGPKKKTARA